MSFIDVIFIGCGVYIIYHSILMRKEAIIPEGVMITKGTILPKDADIAAFILDMFMKGIITGAASCISGCLGMIGSNFSEFAMVGIIGYFTFAIVLVWFCVALKSAHKKYLHIK